MTTRRKTPTGPELSGVTIVVIADSRDLYAAAANRAAELVMQPVVLSAVMDGESRDVGIVLAGIIREIVAAPAACGTALSLDYRWGNDGDARWRRWGGGPIQELALATKINGLADVGCVALGTDGTDGPTEIAGGIVDGTTMERAHREGIDIQHELARHNAGAVLRTLDDAVYTGATGTNLMDLRLLLVRE